MCEALIIGISRGVGGGGGESLEKSPFHGGGTYVWLFSGTTQW